MLFLFLLAPAQRTKLVSSDGDACMHRVQGERMLATMEIVRGDEFSHTRPGHPVVTKEWLAQVLFAIAARARDFTGMCILAAAAIAATFGLLQRQLRVDGNHALVALFVTLLAAAASAPHWHARPHIFTMLMLVMWNGVLRRFGRSGRGVALTLSLGVLTLCWVNLHGGYLAGLLVLGAYGLGTLVEWLGARETSARRDARMRFGTLVLAGFVCVVVSVFNPNGLAVHAHNLQFLRSDFFTNWLDEYQSPNFRSVDSLGFLVWLAVMFAALAWGRKRYRVTEIVLLLSWTYFALYAVRNVSLCVIVTAPIIAPVLSDALRNARSGFVRGIAGRASLREATHKGWPVAAIAAGVVAFLAGPTELPANRWPMSAVEHVKRNPELFSGNMFNLYGWGGYLLFALPDHKVFVDGRADFYGEKLVREYDSVDELRSDWQDVLTRYRIDWTLLPRRHRLNLALALLPEWSRTYEDEVSVIFVRSK